MSNTMSKNITTSTGVIINTMDVIKENEDNVNASLPFETFLNEFTKKIDDYETCNWKTVTHVYSNLWDDISRLRKESSQNLNESNIQFFNNWKYKISFELTEKSHQDQQQIFKDMSWEKSFVLSLLYFIYH